MHATGPPTPPDVIVRNRWTSSVGTSGHLRRYRPSWLNMAESELAILSNQCLDRRVPDRRSLQRQVAAWLLDRNTYNVKANWRFTAADARIKLKSLYPAL